MSITWKAPDVDRKLRADLERAVLAVAKAGSAMDSGSVTISLELNYFGFNSYRNHSSYRKGEFDLLITVTNETKLRRICKGEGRAKQSESSPPFRSGKRLSKRSQPLQSILKSSGTNIPQGWVVAPPKEAPKL